MCGRYVITTSPEQLRQYFSYDERPNMPARYNIAPTQPVPVVLADNETRHFQLIRWGFLPSWLKDPRGFPLLINARAETVTEKAAFRNAIRRRRCLLPADGYYEWQTEGSRKQPFYIRPQAGGPMALAGIAETWTGPNGEEVDTVAIITAEANADLAVLHHRTPVVIAPEDFSLWLDCRNGDAREAISLLVPPAIGAFIWHPVSIAVNRVSNDTPSLLAPVSEAEIAAEAAQASPKITRARQPSPQKPRPDENQGSLF